MTFTQRPNKPTVILVFVLGLLGLTSLACASSARRDAKGFNLHRAYTLPGGSTVSGDQVVMAYNIMLKTDSTVDGSATLTGQHVTMDGTITGDAVIVADRLEIGDQAHVVGDLIACVKQIEKSDSAQIDGEFKEECTNSGSVSATQLIESGWASWRGSIFFRVSTAIVGSLLFGAFAALISTMFPRPLIRMSESVYRSPFAASGVGFLTIVVLIGLTVIYGVSLLLVLPVVLMPLMIVIWLVAGLLGVLGWVALAVPFGVFVLHRVGMDRQPRMIAAAVGGITLGLLLRVWSVFWFTAWIGLLGTIILGSLGLGAVILTRVGTRAYPASDRPTA